MDGEELRVRYCEFMAEVKTRIQSIYDMMEDDNSRVPFVIMLECCYLQLRMITELIAIASLSAHGDVVDGITKALRREYSANRIIEAVELLHPDFYPCPGRQIRGPDGEVVEIKEIKEEFLSKAELKKLYFECGDYLHRGRVGSVLEAKAKIFDQEKGLHWCNLIVNILDHHQIQTADNNLMYWVKMSSGPKGAVQLAVVAKFPPTPSAGMDSVR